MMSDDEAIVYFTVAMTGENWLWSYDLYSAYFNLRKKKKQNTANSNKLIRNGKQKV